MGFGPLPRPFPHPRGKGRGRGPGQLRIHRLRDATELRGFSPDGAATQGGSKWTGSLLHPSVGAALSLASESMQRLGEIATVDIGLVTGANSYGNR